MSSDRAKSNSAPPANRGGSARSKKMKSLYWRIGARVTKSSSCQSGSRRPSRRPRLVEDPSAGPERFVRRGSSLASGGSRRSGGPPRSGGPWRRRVGARSRARRTHQERPGKTPRGRAPGRSPGISCAGQRAGDPSRARRAELPAEMPFTCDRVHARLELAREPAATRSRMLLAAARRASSCAWIIGRQVPARCAWILLRGDWIPARRAAEDASPEEWPECSGR